MSAQADLNAHYISAPLGGKPGAWQAELEHAFAPAETPVDIAERAVQAISRWSGPAFFFLALGAIIYAIAN